MADAALRADTIVSSSETRSIMIALMLAILMGALEQTIVSVALPRMSADLQGVDLLAWVISGYLVAVAVSTPIYGKLSDLYGRRPVLSFAICLFVVASVACALAQSMPMLVAARILQGLGGGGLISVAYATIADVVGPRERGRYQGYISGAYALANVSGPILGGVLTQYLSWRWIFWINLPLGLVTLFIARRALARLPVRHVKRHVKPPVDVPGAILLSASLALLLIGITRVGQGFPWVAPDNLRLFASGALLLAVFVWQERRAEEALIPLPIFRHPAVLICSIVLFTTLVQLVSLTVMIPLRLQLATGSSVGSAAFQLLPLTLATPVGAFMSGRLMARTGRFKHVLLAGAALTPLAVFGLALIDPAATLPAVLCMAVAGLGLGMQMPVATVVVQNNVPPRHMGVATASTSFFRSLGAAMGIAILTAMLLAALQENLGVAGSSLGGAEFMKDMLGEAAATVNAVGRSQLLHAVHGAFREIFLAVAGVGALSFVLCLLLRDQVLSDR